MPGLRKYRYDVTLTLSMPDGDGVVTYTEQVVRHVYSEAYYAALKRLRGRMDRAYAVTMWHMFGSVHDAMTEQVRSKLKVGVPTKELTVTEHMPTGEQVTISVVRSVEG